MSLNKSKCKDCAKNNSTTWWCHPCNSERFQEDFPKWTSGNELVDKFIQDAQLNARNKDHVVEWIPYEKFQNIEFIADGGFSKVYKADWPEGRIICSGIKSKRWWREKSQNQSIPVVLKSLNNSENINEEILGELKNQLQFIRNFKDEDAVVKSVKFVLLIFGITRDPSTNNFMMVTKYANRGSLRSRLQNPDLPQYEWSVTLLALRDLTTALASIHKTGLFHGDFHSGNILIEYVDTPYISDFGLSRNKNQNDNKNEKKVFGILPYVAPEVLNGHPYTQAADIYSLGMILWEYIAKIPPFNDRAHDFSLGLDICKGLRPKILAGTPTIYANLMKQCWDKNPEKRPTAHKVKEIVAGWHDAYARYSFAQPLTNEQEEIGKIFEAAEEYRLKIVHGGTGEGKIGGNPTHPGAWTVSRLLNFSLLEKKSQEEPELEIIDKEKETLDKTGHLITYETTMVDLVLSDSEEDED